MRAGKWLAAALILTMSAQPAFAEGYAEVNADPANTVKSEETLYVGFASEPSTLWLAAAGKIENEPMMIQNLYTDTLVYEDPATHELLPSLATDWEWTDDTHCTFSLRDDALMVDGTPLEAADVVYTAGIWKENNQANDTGMYLEGAKEIDEHTVEIAFNTAAPDLLYLLSWPTFGIVCEADVEAAGGLEAAQRNPVIGTGRYRFKEWKNGVSITLERNEDYWNPDYTGYFKEIVVRFTADPAAREMAVESGDADVAYDIPVIQASTFVSKDNIKTYAYPRGSVSHLWYNMGDKAGATKDILVRKAIDKALNFEAIAQVATAGTAQQALGYVVPEDSFYVETATPEDRLPDPEGAKELLAEAGYGDGLELNILGLQDMIPVATVIQANLAEAGIKLDINTPDTAQFVSEAFAGDYDIIIVDDSVTPRLPNAFLFMSKASLAGGTIVGGPKWTTDELDAAITNFIKAKDHESAQGFMDEITETINSEMVESNLYPTVQGLVTSKDISGVSIMYRGYIDLGSMYK